MSYKPGLLSAGFSVSLNHLFKKVIPPQFQNCEIVGSARPALPLSLPPPPKKRVGRSYSWRRGERVLDAVEACVYDGWGVVIFEHTHPPPPQYQREALSRRQFLRTWRCVVLYRAVVRVPPEDHASFERTSHFYERREGDAYLRRGPAPAYHVTAPDPLRGRTRDRLYRNGPYSQLIESSQLCLKVVCWGKKELLTTSTNQRCQISSLSVVSEGGVLGSMYAVGDLSVRSCFRAQLVHHRPIGSAWSYEGTPSVRYSALPPTLDPYPEERREPQPVVHKKRPKSRSGSESGSNSGSSRSRSRSRSRSHSSTSSSQSGSSSSCSGTSTAGTEKSCSPHSSHHGTVRSGRVGGVALQSTVSAPHANNINQAVHSEDRRPLAICVRNLPVRSSADNSCGWFADTSLKDGLFHEYKKHGKVTWVKVVGQAGDRYAVVCFKKPDDVEKALEESHDKLFFGCKIAVAPCQYDVEDNDFRPYEAEMDEFNPKATRTLFIGNLEKDVTGLELRKTFEQFGEIIDIDIKKQGVSSSYAFCQYADISSVVKAMRMMDGEQLGNNRMKLGYGKSMPTNCVWVDGVADTVTEKYLNLQFHQFGSISNVTIDRERGHALVYFEQILYAQEAVRDMRGVMLRGRKLQVDFASRECQEAFYDHLVKQGHAVVGGERPWDRYDNSTPNSREVQAGRFETTVVVPGARFTRYEVPQRPRSSSYNRTPNNTSVPAIVGANPVPVRAGVRAQRVGGQRYEYYDAEYPDRRYRNYDEFSQGSGASHDDSYEQDLREYGYCQRERGDSSPSPVSCETEGPVSSRRSVAVIPALQSVVVGGSNDGPTLAPNPPDIRHLQKERVHIQHLLEQLDCTSSGDEEVPKKRVKLGGEEGVNESRVCGISESCFDGMNHVDVNPPPSLLVTTHNHRKSVSEVRRLSDVSGKHCSSRRPSTDSSKRETSADRLVCVPTYSPHPVCKRRKTGSSASESEERGGCGRSNKHSHHHHHHHSDQGTIIVSGGESVDGSRPGTPLCDERPENLLPPLEPRRPPRDRLSSDGPLSLPLPRFAAQVLSASPRLSVSIAGVATKPVVISSSILSSPPPVMTSPRPNAHQTPAPCPSPAPPPASPPPRPPSLLSTTSSDSEVSPPSPTLEERIRSLDEKYEKWSGSRTISAAGGDALAKLDASASERFRFRHKLLDLNLTDVQPSEIVKSVLAKRSVFDEDSKRLENVGEKYEPREFVPFSRGMAGCLQGLRVKTECSVTPTKPIPSPSPTNTPTTPGVPGKPCIASFPSPSTSQVPPRLLGSPSPMHSPSHQLPKSPFSSGTPTTPVGPPKPPHTSLSPVGISPLMPSCSKIQSVPKTLGAVSPRPTTTGLPAAKGLQYPFPSHPPVLPTTTVATTTATTATVLVSVSSAGVKPSLSVTIPTTATGTVLSLEVNRTCVVKPVNTIHSPSKAVALVTVPTTATSTKPSAEIASRISLPVSSSSAVLSTVPGRLHPPSVSKLSTPVKPLSSAGPNTSISDPRLVARHPCIAAAATGSLSVGMVSSTVISKVSTVTSTQLTAKVCSTASMGQTMHRVPVTGVRNLSSTTTQSITSQTSLSKIMDHSPKIIKEGNTVLNIMDPAHSSSNIPVSSIQSTVISTSSSRIVPISPTVTAVAATGTVTTTVLTMTTASTSIVNVTSSISEVSMPSPAVTSSSDLLRPNAKSKSCSPIKKEMPSQCLSSVKEKLFETSTKPTPPQKKDNVPNIPVNSTFNSALKKEKDCNGREQDTHRGGNNVKPRGGEERRPSSVCARRDSAKERRERESTDSDKPEKERRRDSMDGDRKKDKETTDTLDRRKDSTESESADKERWKDKDENQEKDKRKENHLPENVSKETEDKDKRKEIDTTTDCLEKRKEKKKSRTNSGSSPASIGCKRRMSSQDSIDSVPDDAKRLKLSPASAVQEHRKVPERRDSKDSGRSSSSSSKKSGGERPKGHSEKVFTKLLEEKIREDNKSYVGRETHRDKSKDKPKKKKSDRDSPKDQRESSGKINKDVPNDKDFSPKASQFKKDDSDPDDREVGKHKHAKKESKEKKKQSKDEFGSSEFLDEKGKTIKKEKRIGEKIKEEPINKDDPKPLLIKKEKKPGHTDSESEDGSGLKKHSIFDIIDDGPAYISMYDKVKARSTKNMQKQEEEKRQEKMREKFNLLKQSRAKREEKKRSTSWDEDSESDAERELSEKPKRHNKAVISSSSEDGDREERKNIQARIRPVVRIKKEDLSGAVRSDSDSDILGVRRSLVSEDDESSARTKNVCPSRKSSRAKLISDTSEDDVTSSKTKINVIKTEVYSAESEVDMGFADYEDKHHLNRKNMKNNKINKNIMEMNDEISKNANFDLIKTLGDKPNFKKVSGKNKGQSMKSSLDSSDDEPNIKFSSDIVKTEIFGEEKPSGIKKNIGRNKLNKCSVGSSEDESSKKLLDLIKSESHMDEKPISLTQVIVRNKIKKSLESSDDDDILKTDIFGDEKQLGFKKSSKNKMSKNVTEFSMQDSVTKKYLPDVDKLDMFGDVIPHEKNALTQNKNAILFNDIEVKVNSTSLTQIDKKTTYYENSVDKVGEVVRKKQHKNKKRRQKNFQMDEEMNKSEPLNKDDDHILTPEEEAKLKADRKRHKRERRKSTHSDDRDSKSSKPRKKRLSKPELGVLKIESNLKREEKMEDIFGPLSDDSEPGIVKQSPIPHDNGGRSLDKLGEKWQVSLVYGSDSESSMGPQIECFVPREKEKKKKDKKRREKKSREMDAGGVDLVEAGRALEAKLLGHDDYPHLSPITPMSAPTLTRSEDTKPILNHETDVFRFTDGDDSLETMLVEKIKEKKKKRKKSKEEKQNRREHHHHHHHDKNKQSPDRKLSVSSLEDSKPPALPSPSLPSLEMPLSPPPSKPLLEDISNPPILHEAVASPPPKILPVVSSKPNEKKKPDKFIPGFGTDIDDIIHETAVKSISEFETPKQELASLVKDNLIDKAESKNEGDDLNGDDEKPRAVISQEETEDAVAALLGESFGGDFADCYVGEGHTSPAHRSTANPAQLPTDEEEETRQAVEGLIDMKPDTPQSEPDLQIDTDTDHEVDDNYSGLRFGADESSSPRTSDGIDFSRPPKTPDFHPSYYGQQQQSLVKSFEADSSTSATKSVVTRVDFVERTSSSPASPVPSPLPEPLLSPPRILPPESTLQDDLEKEEHTSIKVNSSVNLTLNSASENVPEPLTKETEKLDVKDIDNKPKEEPSPPILEPEVPCTVIEEKEKVSTEKSSETTLEQVPSITSQPPQISPLPLKTHSPQSSPKPSLFLSPSEIPEFPPETTAPPKITASSSEIAEPQPETIVPPPPQEVIPTDVPNSPELEIPITSLSDKIENITSPPKEERPLSPKQKPVDEIEPQVDKPCLDVTEDIKETISKVEEPCSATADILISGEPESNKIGKGRDEENKIGKGGDEEKTNPIYESPILLKDIIEPVKPNCVKEEPQLQPVDYRPNIITLDYPKPSDSEHEDTQEEEKTEPVKREDPFKHSALAKSFEMDREEDDNKDITQATISNGNRDMDISPFKGADFGLPSDEGRSFICSSKEDSGFVSAIKEEQCSDIARESDFSEPESDMKQDNDFVASILASESMNHALNTDDSRSGHESGGDEPFKEREIETVSVIKETDAHLRFKEEKDPFASPITVRSESPNMKDSFDVLMINKDMDSGLLTGKCSLSNAIRVDSDFWSAKEVNIESVIKKVDALCSADELGELDANKESEESKDKKWFDMIRGKDNGKSLLDIPKKVETKLEHPMNCLSVVKQEEIFKNEIKINNKEDKSDVKPDIEKPTPDETEVKTNLTPDHDEHYLKESSPPDESNPFLVSDEGEQIPTSAESSHEDEADTFESSTESLSGNLPTPRTSRRGRRGVGGRRKIPARSIATRKTRTTTGRKQQHLASDSSISPRRGGRPSRGGGNKSPRHDHLFHGNKKASTDVYEFHDDSEEEGGNGSGEKNRPRLILTIKSPISGNPGNGKDSAIKIPPTVTVVETREEFPIPSAATTTTTTTTRKSRRLQEKDGSRNTVDEVIDDVIRAATVVTRSASAAAVVATSPIPTRRSSRQTAGHRVPPIVVEPKKASRNGKKRAKQRRASETHDDSGEESKKKTYEEYGRRKSLGSPTSSGKETSDSFDMDKPLMSPVKSKDEALLSSVPHSPSPAKPRVEENKEPMTLIDPVTGLLMVMRESEEGQYIPVTTAPVVVTATPTPSEGNMVEKQVDKGKILTSTITADTASTVHNTTLSKKTTLPSTIMLEQALREQQCSLYLAVPPPSPAPPMCACAQQSNTTSLAL
uniref:RRM domain-containing protein n=2 Tax=Timema TaxID=61471 RepID=A0A7R9E394_9NEOP|nr:unnamed protein product [Timema monikensis]